LKREIPKYTKALGLRTKKIKFLPGRTTTREKCGITSHVRKPEIRAEREHGGSVSQG
jgi:hypothetical protein